MLISGAIAGLSGMLHLAGPAQRLNSSISNNYGLSGFIVAALAGTSVVGVVVGSVFIAAMLHAGITLQAEACRCTSWPRVYGLVLLGIAVGEVAARFRLVRSQRAAGAAVPHERSSPTSSRRRCRRAPAWRWPPRARCSTSGPAC